jgi:2-oxoglutarate ferredoxin oxidoreductase subunit beta
MPDDLTTDCENTWCPGCGNFGLFTAVKKAVRTLESRGLPRERLFVSAGIGCHGKTFDYLALSGFYSLHGRSMATVQGVKLANPELKALTFAGDGDAYGEGLEHMVFAAKRNADITILVHNNGVYGLTVGQFTPVSKRGFKGPSSPRGSVEEPLNPLAILLESGATFVARGFTGRPDHLSDLVVQAVEHEGFSYVDILQPCVSFNDTHKLYNELVEQLPAPAKTREEAVVMAKRQDRINIGLFWQDKSEPFHRSLYGDWNPVSQRLTRDERLSRVRKALEGG